MIDKLSLTSDQRVTSHDVSLALQGQFSRIRIARSQYHEHVLDVRTRSVVGKEMSLLSVHFGPRGEAISNTKIELNPNHFSSFEKLTNLLASLVDPLNLRITRIDHEVDLKIDIKNVSRALFYPHKRRREVCKNGGDITGFYIGKYPELLSVYDRSALTKTPGPITRIELRQFHRAVPIKMYSDLPKLITMEIFDRVRFFKIRQDDINDRLAFKSIKLNRTISEYGFQGASRILNQNSNFFRNYSEVLTDSDEFPNLTELYQESLFNFFSAKELREGMTL